MPSRFFGRGARHLYHAPVLAIPAPRTEGKML